MLKISGYLREIGDFSVLGTPGRGFLIECEDRDITVIGLTKSECRSLGSSLMQRIEINIGGSEAVPEGRRE